jgi:hypothetical protein
MRAVVSSFLLIACTFAARGGGAEWTFLGPVAEGTQIDAVRGPNDRIHLVSSKYYQFDSDGNELVAEAQGDGRQGNLDFPPAIAVGTDGSVHIVTRHDGDWNAGHDIRYRRRSPSGVWDQDYIFGSRAKRNYVVSVAWAGAGDVYMSYTEAGDNVWGDVRLWKAGSGSATDLGTVAGIWRSDTDTRMRGRAGKVFMVSGKCDTDGKAYFLYGNAGANVKTELDASKRTHSAGSGRKGFADLYVDGNGDIHFTYGALYTVYYNRYDAQGQKALASDVEIFNGLGDCHMSAGLSAVAASDDGNTVVAVALKSDGSQAAVDSDVLWACSVDAGQTWSTPQDTGRNTHGGEGRRRPRLAAIGRKFFLFYKDNSSSGISLATLEFGTPGNQAPIAHNQTVTVPEDGSVAVTLSYTDFDGPSPYTFTITQDPAHGSLTGTGGSRTYAPNAGYLGTDSFKWKVSDGELLSNEATVAITVAGNQPPVAQDQSASVVQGHSVLISLSYTDEAPGTCSFTITQPPSDGALSGTGGERTYTPDKSFTGTDTFNWKVTDAKGAGSDVATVTITVTPNQPPVARDASVSVKLGESVEFRLEYSDTDGPGPNVPSVASAPAHGTASINGDLCTYTPDSGYLGMDSFTYKVNDGVSDSAPATVTIRVYTDTDGDGLPDYWEQRYFDPAEPTILNPTSADSDGDGVNDGNEDDDGDGCLNIDEYRLGRNPTVADGPRGSSGLGCLPIVQMGASAAGIAFPALLVLGLLASARKRPPRS